ncbi:helix-turn-helix domain-containing protein [Spirosoma panaciterrae]|uniref:helix-turn-helix domain-containing protein n=1 Tax=Spirosoma panaciterrae TaxID=496058 RepID=UPI0003662F9C|nr:helix-turn-helix domain-containing protein [Spirosoma panaciterrae]
MLVNFQQLQDDLSTIKETMLSLAQRLDPTTSSVPDDRPLSVTEAAEFLGIAEQTLYQHVKRIPHRKRFNRLYFFKAELLAYLNGEEVHHD